MTPSIRYAKTRDGVSIAFATMGEGVPILFVPPAPFSHLEAMWELPGTTRWFERLARHAQVAIYDSRSTGLSDRDVTDFSVDALGRDLEAVVRSLGWTQFVLCGFFNAGPVAIAYAAAHEEAVSDLVLWGAYARGTDMFPLPFAVNEQIADLSWPMLVDTAARVWTAGDRAETQATAAYFRASVGPMAGLRAFAAAREYDVRALLPDVDARTLVLQRRDATVQRIDLARELATGIPHAELLVLAGNAASPFSGDVDAGVAAIERFLGVGDEDAAAPPSTPTPESLTPREQEVLRLVARGRANKEIAYDLGLSVHTVERHLTNLYPKIGLPQPHGGHCLRAHPRLRLTSAAWR